jgi:protein-disulfide isomerase
VEFTDYECTLCSRYFTQSFPLIKENYIDTGKVRYETRNFPLSLIHPYALIASEAAFCALKEDRFWPMHDKLLGSQAEWTAASDPVTTIRGYAKSLGLNMSSFGACLDNHETQSLVERDLADARGAGINGSPSFWVFGTGGVVRQINGAYPYATFQATFDAMLKP